MSVKYSKLKKLDSRRVYHSGNWVYGWASETTISKYETGYWKLPRNVAEKIAEALDVPVEEIVEEKEILAEPLPK